MISLADLTELESSFLARANTHRDWSETGRTAALRHHHGGVALMAEDAAKAVREIITKHSPRPALRLVLKEAADV